MGLTLQIQGTLILKLTMPVDEGQGTREGGFTRSLS